MNILVTGASGFIGLHLVKKLAANPAHRISALTRIGSAIPELKKTNARLIECDITDAERLGRVTGNDDIVIHLAAVKEHYKSRGMIISTNVQGTKNVLDCSRNAKQFIFASSTLVSNPTDAYSESKKQCEELIKSSGINYTILRLAPVFGSGDNTNLTKLIELIRDGKAIPIPGNGKQLIQPTHVDDVVDAIERSISNSAFFNKTSVVAGRPITLEDFIASVGRTLDRNARSIHVPVGLLKPLVKVYQRVSDAPKITVEQLDNLGKLRVSEVFESDFPTSRLEVSIQKTAATG